MEWLALFLIIIFVNIVESDGSCPGNKLNPLWWFGNDNDPVENHDRYLPDKPLWYRRVRWAIRNPLENFDRYVIGTWDKPAFKPGRFWADDRSGFSITLPWISYKGLWVEWYFGWKPGGEFGFALRKTKSKGF